MQIKDLFIVKKAITTSREFFENSTGVLCVHYGDIYKNYSYKIINSSNIINRYSEEIDDSKIIKIDSLIMPDVTETVSDFGHISYFKHTEDYINGTHTFALLPKDNDLTSLKYMFYYMQCPRNQKRIQTMLLGSTVFQLSKKDLENFELTNYHSHTEQQHIIDIIINL